MTKIGLSANELFHYAIKTNLTIESSRVSDALDEYNNGEIEKDLLQASLTLAKNEAVFNTVALMIDENNKHLLKHLEELGVLGDKKE